MLLSERVSFPFLRSITIELTWSADHVPDAVDDDVAAYLREIDGVGVLRARDIEDAVFERSGDRHHLASFERFVLKRTTTAT